MRWILNKILNLRKELKRQPGRLEINSEDQVFLRTAGEQLKELARKGLSIPVFTL